MEAIKNAGTIAQHAHALKTITIDGDDQTILKSDVHRVAVNPHLVKPPLPFCETGRSFELLKLATSTCTVTILMPERSLTYTTVGYVPPNSVVAIDTNKKLVYTESGTSMPAQICMRRPSTAESAWVEIALLKQAVEKMRHEGATRSGGEQCERHAFIKEGSVWNVIFHGSTDFYIKDSLGARYLDYLLHHPNVPMSSYDLEIAIRPQQAEARPRDSIQMRSDPEAIRSYLRELKKLRTEREEASDEGDHGEVDRLDGEIGALEDALESNQHASDAGERARGNVSKAIRAVLRKLGKGDPCERAFSEHLKQFLHTGYNCMYSQPEGRIWR